MIKINSYCIATIVLWTLLAFECNTQPEYRFVLSEKNIGSYDIIIYDTSSVIQKFAAKELQLYLMKIYKHELPIQDRNDLSRLNHFFLGSGFVKDSLFQVDTISKYAIIQCFHNGNVYLAGYDPKIESIKKQFFKPVDTVIFGTLTATYDFIENNLGVNWFFPTFLGEFVPNSKSISFEEKVRITEPDFNDRSFYWKSLYHNKDTIMYWMLRNKLMETSNSIYKHNWHNLVPSTEYFDTMPELFAEINGKRIHKTSNIKAHGNSAQLCTSNPATIDLVIKNIIGSIDTTQQSQKISLYLQVPDI